MRRPRRIPCLAAVVAFASVFAGFAPASGVDARGGAPRPAAEHSRPAAEGVSRGLVPGLERTGDGGPRVGIVSVGDPVLKPGADLTVTAVVSNPGKKPLTITRSVLSAQSSVPTTRNQLLTFVRGSSSGRMQAISERTGQRTVPAGGEIEVTFTVPRREIDWGSNDSTWGPRGIEVAVETDGRKLSDRSFVVAAPAFEVKPMPTSVVLPVTASVDELANVPSVEESIEGEEREAPKRVADTLSAMAVPGVTVVLDPLLVESDGTHMRDALRAFTGASGTQLLLTSPGDADVAAIVHDCQAKGQRYECVRAYLSNGAVRSQATASRIASEFGVPAPRTDISLLAPGTDLATVEALAASGTNGAVLPASDIPVAGRAYASTTARTAIPDVEMTALASDTSMSAAFAGRTPSAGESDAEQRPKSADSLDDLDSRQLLLGMSAVTYRERPNDSRVTVIQIDRASLPGRGVEDPAGSGEANPLNPNRMRQKVEALMGASWVEPATADRAFATVPADVQREAPRSFDRADGELSQSELQRIDSSLAGFGTVASLVEDPRVLSEPAQARGFQLTSIAWRSAPAARKKALASFASESLVLASAIRVQPSSTVNVISEATSIPLRVASSLPVRAKVTVTLESRDQRLKATKNVNVMLDPRGTTKVLVPVKALGSGNITASIRVVDSIGRQIGPSRTLDLRVRADWENIGTLVFGLFFFALLVVGLVRSLRRGRRSHPISPLELRRRLAKHAEAE